MNEPQTYITANGRPVPLTDLLGILRRTEMKKRKSFTHEARICGTTPSSAQLEAAGWARLVAQHGNEFQYGIFRLSGFGHYSGGRFIKGYDVRVNSRGGHRTLNGVTPRDFEVSFTRDKGFCVSA